jgi:recombination protein RecA
MTNDSESESDKASVSRKDMALQQALDQIETSFGKGSIMWLNRIHQFREVPVISTGSLALDLALRIGGLPKVSLVI